MNFNYHRVALRIDKWRRRPKRQGRDTSHRPTPNLVSCPPPFANFKAKRCPGGCFMIIIKLNINLNDIATELGVGVLPVMILINRTW